MHFFGSGIGGAADVLGGQSGAGASPACPLWIRYGPPYGYTYTSRAPARLNTSMLAPSATTGAFTARGTNSTVACASFPQPTAFASPRMSKSPSVPAP